MKPKSRSTLLLALILLACRSAEAITLYSNGFETDISGWLTPTQVASGTGGITSSSGSYHATTAEDAGDFTRWGGYNFGAGNAVPTAFQEYTTSLDIYLDVDGGWANDTRFDFSSAINNAAGVHLRDFAFNAGFYDDATGLGAGTDRFVISAGNNTGRANSFPKNTNAIAISDTGWYTFTNHFYNLGGFLAVDMEITDSSNAVVNDWTINTTDLIAATGGNRYGFFASNEFPTLAFDNTEMHTNASEPAPTPDSGSTLILLGSAIMGLAAFRRKLSA